MPRVSNAVHRAVFIQQAGSQEAACKCWVPGCHKRFYFGQTDLYDVCHDIPEIGLLKANVLIYIYADLIHSGDQLARKPQNRLQVP